MSEDQPRAPFSGLRSWLPEHDDGAREGARAVLVAHIESAARAAASPSRRRGWRWGRWAASIGGALLVAGAGVAIASDFWRTAHTGHLAIFAADGTLSAQFHVGSRAPGRCWTASLAASGEADAFRCMAGNAINDPCFAASPHATSVACFLDPWHAVTMLRLTAPLPRHGPVESGALPWAIETTSGLRCTYFTGATAPMGGERINYGCNRGWFLIGAPDRSQALWTIRSSRRYVPDTPGHPTPLRRFPLAKIQLTVP